MQEITSTAGLKNAIQLLEVEQTIKGQLLKEQFSIAYDSFKPVNLLKGALKDISTSPFLIDNILGTAMGLATGSLSKKIIVGSSANLFRKLFGSLLQFGVTTIVAKNPEAIKLIRQLIFQHLLHKKKRILNSRDK
jgi:hypothetical protein